MVKMFYAKGILAVSLVVMAVVGCAEREKSWETRNVMEKNLEIMEDFIHSVEDTEDPQVYLSALQKMKGDLQILIPEMNELSKKYPELFKLGENKEPTPELKHILKELWEREAEVRSQFVLALQKVMKSADVPEIKTELQEIFELQKKLAH